MNITSNGTYNITPSNHRFSAGTVFSSGSLGAGSATFSYKSKEGTVTALNGGTLVVGTEHEIKHGQLADIKLVVTGSDGSTNFNVDYHGSN